MGVGRMGWLQGRWEIGEKFESGREVRAVRRLASERGWWIYIEHVDESF